MQLVSAKPTMRSSVAILKLLAGRSLNPFVSISGSFPPIAATYFEVPVRIGERRGVRIASFRSFSALSFAA
jgi:hypothetical protein